ncbi:MAG: hypothetical protein J7M26_05160 [Armatimonadetes bacterium]|nr:hypothetical protein [Armatimonadota bacterium]
MRVFHQRFAICCTIVLLASVSRAAGPLRPQIAVPLMNQAPTLDGRIVEKEWAGAARMVGLVSQHGALLESREAVFWVGADPANLYLALRTELPPDGKLLTRAVPDGDRDIVAAVHDDSVELVIHPHLGATSGDRRYFHIIVNARGAMFDRTLDPTNKANPVDVSWRLKNWTFANSTHDGWWDGEIGIPFASLGATTADLSQPWGLRVCRNWQRPWDQSRWESFITAYEDVPTMPRVSFSQTAPVVQMLGLRNAKKNKPRIELGLSNPGEAPLRVKVFLSDAWSHNPPTELQRQITLARGTQKHVVFEPPHGGPEGEHHTVVKVTSLDGKEVFYLRDFRWKLQRPAERWAIAREEKQAVGLDYAVYPYLRKLKVRVNIKALASRNAVRQVRVDFRRSGASRPLASRTLNFAHYVAEGLLDLPDLAAGNYEVRATLVPQAAALDRNTVPTDPVIATYERRVFPWEHNKLGLSHPVIPPFTPLRFSGRKLTAVLREHLLRGDGLWDQVTSLRRPLLKAPMRWVVKSSGRFLPVVPGELAVHSARDDEVELAGSFAAGPLRAKVLTHWEQDGMGEVTLVLLPGRGRVDRLSLEIPLDDAEMPYMHACGDGLRYNYAGATPAGQGPVWDSSKANKTNIVGTFYPYLWLGGGERGLAWFADSDRDWSLDDATPTVQVERHGGTLLLRVNFITRPTDLRRERRIVFGLQATPVKPMPTKPVSWRRWICHYYDVPRVQPFNIIGATFYWGAMSYDLYPRGRDTSILEAFSRARDTGQYDEAFVNKWMEGYKQYVKPGSDQWDLYLRHVRAGMRSAASVKRSEGWLWTPYTNPRGGSSYMDEWPVFQDEWLNFAYHKRAVPDSVAYDVTPVRSFQDAAMWYYRDLMTCFDGIYWDNLFLAADYDTVASDAWVDEKGRVHPSMGLWAMRDLVKRTAFLFNEQGRPVFANVVHMTNTNIVPILAFANINLDWEWKYGKTDFQDRFSPELTVAETIGRQCGNVPLILAGGHTPPSDPAYQWLMRTRLGVCLVHELRVWDWRPAWHYDFYGKLFAFGYGDPACRVYNYWDEGFPLRIEGCDVRGIVIVMGKKALVIVTDYGKGGRCRLTLDLKGLGLPPSVHATDFETGAAIAGKAPGVVEFPLKKHDFRAVVFE